MKVHGHWQYRGLSVLAGFLISLALSKRALAEPPAEAVRAFDAYVTTVEARLGRQHQTPGSRLCGLGSGSAAEGRLRHGELSIEAVGSAASVGAPGALLRHWRGSAFAPGARASDLEHLLRDFNGYPKHFYPQVLQARVLSGSGDHLLAFMRVRQKHVLTVVMDATYDVTFGGAADGAGYSASRSTQIYEIDGAGSSRERSLGGAEEHGFLWRLNTYWTYEEGDGGLYIQIESVSLSRAIPAGLGWALRPYVESVPRESLEFTLRSALDAIRK